MKKAILMMAATLIAIALSPAAHAQDAAKKETAVNASDQRRRSGTIAESRRSRCRRSISTSTTAARPAAPVATSWTRLGRRLRPLGAGRA